MLLLFHNKLKTDSEIIFRCGLGVSLIAVVMTITCLSGLYRTCLTGNPQNNSSEEVPSMDLSSFGRNAMFFWSHLTNRGNMRIIIYRLNLSFSLY